MFYAALVVVLLVTPDGFLRPESGTGAMSKATGGRAPGRTQRPAQRPRLKGGGLLALIAIAIAFPQVYSNPAVTNYGVFALIYVTAAIGWNIFSGNTGYISLGQAVFYGSGAYAMGIAARDWNIRAPRCSRCSRSRGGRGGHRRPVRPRRAAGAAAHVHRDHDRLLLHLPADGVQLLLHRRVERPGLAVPELAGGGLQHALLLHRARLRGRLRRHRLAGRGGPGSASSCGRSGTTRTGRAASASGHAGQAVARS